MASNEQAQPAANTASAPQPTITPEAAQAALSQPTRVEAVPNSAPAAAAKPDPNRPAWLPEKFKSPEDMARSYTELEKRLSGTKPTEPAKPEPTKGEAGKTAEDLSIKAAEAQAEAKGIDLTSYEAEFTKDGTLSEKSYEALAKSGIPKEMVDTYIQGRQALMERSAEATLKAVGLDMDGYQKLGQWAASTLPKAELDAYNRIVTGTDVDAARLALQGLHAKYSQSIEPDYLRGGSPDRSGGDVFRSTAELTKAMADPRYAKDPAYRDDVAKKLGRSNIL